MVSLKSLYILIYERTNYVDYSSCNRTTFRFWSNYVCYEQV